MGVEVCVGGWKGGRRGRGGMVYGVLDRGGGRALGSWMRVNGSGMKI